MAFAKADTAKLSETAQSVANDVAERARDVRDSAASGAADLKKAVNDAVSEAGELASDASKKLKAVGIDTDVMVSAAKDQAGEWQKLLAEELKTRPMRALGLAAAAGLIVGYLSRR